MSQQKGIRHARVQLEAGADLIDLGAESSRPGADSISVEQELARLLPVLRALRDCGVPISVDTLKPQVMRVALDEGADMINDINALQAPAALETLARYEAAVCLMHMQGRPDSMQNAPHYKEVTSEVSTFLARRVAACEQSGIMKNRILIDPGFGFGKTLAHNLDLLRYLGKIAQIGGRKTQLPVMVGISRKSMLGALTGQDVSDRLAASIAAALVSVSHGARVVRVHDVRASKDALSIWSAATLPPIPAVE